MSDATPVRKKSNPTAVRRPIELDRTRHLLYDFNAMAAIEEAAGLPGSTITAAFWKNISAKHAIVALWAGLLDDDPALTLEDVKKLIRAKNPMWIVEQITLAWGESEPEKAEDPNPTTAATPTPIQ